ITLQRVLDQLRAEESETIARFPLTQMLTIFQKVCDAVAFAHSKGVLHRDLKPENIMLGEFGEVQVMDWGLAKLLQSRAGVPPAQTDETLAKLSENEAEQRDLDGEGRRDACPTLDPIRTLEGRVMGSPSFMAPEQAEGRNNDIDERTDIYALGGILYT